MEIHKQVDEIESRQDLIEFIEALRIPILHGVTGGFACRSGIGDFYRSR